MGTSSKLADLVHPDQFSVLLRTDFGSRGDPNVRGTPGVRLRGCRQNSHIWSNLTSFLCYYPLIFGPGAIRTFGEPRRLVMGTSSKLADFVHSDQFSVLLLIDFGSRGDPNVRGTPRVRLRGPRQNSQFWSILTSFLSYYSLILGPGAIRTYEEPRGPVTGTSSKLVYFVHSGQFSMLLLTDFGSRGDPNVRGTPGSGYGDVVKTRIFGPILPVFCAITH